MNRPPQNALILIEQNYIIKTYAGLPVDIFVKLAPVKDNLENKISQSDFKLADKYLFDSTLINEYNTSDEFILTLIMFKYNLSDPNFLTYVANCQSVFVKEDKLMIIADLRKSTSEREQKSKFPFIYYLLRNTFIIARTEFKVNTVDLNPMDNGTGRLFEYYYKLGFRCIPDAKYTDFLVKEIENDKRRQHHARNVVNCGKMVLINSLDEFINGLDRLINSEYFKV
jgi:hypothetical protein